MAVHNQSSQIRKNLQSIFSPLLMANKLWAICSCHDDFEFLKIAEAGLKSHVKHLRGEFMHGNKYIQINKDRTNRHLVSSNLIENGISKLTLNSTV